MPSKHTTAGSSPARGTKMIHLVGVVYYAHMMKLGIHGGLRSRCRKAWGFESLYVHEVLC